MLNAPCFGLVLKTTPYIKRQGASQSSLLGKRGDEAGTIIISLLPASHRNETKDKTNRNAFKDAFKDFIGCGQSL